MSGVRSVKTKTRCVVRHLSFLKSTTAHSGLNHVVCRPNPKTLNTRFGVGVLLKRGLMNVSRRSTTHHGRDVGTRAKDCLCLEQHGHRRTHFIRPRTTSTTPQPRERRLCCVGRRFLFRLHVKGHGRTSQSPARFF